ncbi:unnamed protein product [Blepharisma stoltei]|uniref:Uncharacterized protein n=1 Tax=Blepharisma stoltei TaxID=1481888 RepID=A0AAU9JIV9_9CILI|nr:unnamed protein product [Blepharisma stoltei]
MATVLKEVRVADWNESLCGCFNGIGSCLWVLCIPYGACCLQGMAIQIATEGTEGCFLPCWVGACWWPTGMALNRGNIRGLFRIQGNWLCDCCIHYYCFPFASCQEYREARYRMG